MSGVSEKYKLVIVDDEKHIREGLSYVLDWESVGFSVSGVFEDGRDAISFISQHSVDVILTDIRMPHVSGLELAKYVWENRLKIKILILTGYKDFDYARRACQYGVSDYLLKPTDIAELYETFRKLKEQMDVEKEEIISVNQFMEGLIEQFFSDVYLGAFADENAVQEQSRRLNLEKKLEKAVFSVLQISIENYESINRRGYNKEQIYETIHHFLQMKYPDFAFIVIYRENEDLTYIAYGKEGLPDDVHAAVPSELGNVMDFWVNLKVEGEYRNLYELMRDKKKLDGFVDLKQLVEKQKLLFSCIFSNQSEQAQTLFQTMFESLASVDDEAAHNFIQNLFSLLAQKIADAGIVCEDGFFELPSAAEGKEKIERKCTENISLIAQVVRNNMQGAENLAVSQAKKFINDNYSRDIMLEDVANEVFLSPAYLSRIFKKYVGENFSDYLFKVRMNKAKSLLKSSNLKIYEIAEKIGIQTPKYFFKIFKNYTGLTPTEYRMNLADREGEKT